MAQQAGEAGATDYLDVPGARLWYEVTGSGPVLLLIPQGGPIDADSYAPIVGFLAEDYTVVRYDTRGISRSRLDDPAADVPVDVHADDARRLLAAIGDEPAYVLGSSGGAVIGLALVERYPELVQALVAHEPPLNEFLPEDDARRNQNREIYDLYQREGAGPALAMFLGGAGLEEPAPPDDLSPEAQAAMEEEMARVQQNLDFFFAHYLLPVTSYVPDIAALRTASTRVVPGAGEATTGEMTNDTALALAERLGTEAVLFPGDHFGFMAQPEAFAAKLNEVFRVA